MDAIPRNADKGGMCVSLCEQKEGSDDVSGAEGHTTQTQGML